MAAHSSEDFILEDDILTDIEEDLECEDEKLAVLCICSLPSTEDLISCSGTKCPVGLYHRKCVGLPCSTTDSATDDATPTPTATVAAAASHASVSDGDLDDRWLCGFCSNEISDTPADTKSSSESSSVHTSSEASSATCPPSSGETPGTSSADIKKKERRTKTKFGALRNREEVMSQSALLYKETVLQLKADEFYTGTEVGRQVIALADDIDCDAPAFEESLQNVVQDICDIISSAEEQAVGPVANTHILTKFQAYKCGEKATRLFLTMMSVEEQSVPFRFFQQYVLRVMLEKIMKLIRGDGFISEEEKKPLSAHDEQVLRYVSGYIPYALCKKFGRMKSPSAHVVTEFLRKWKKEDDDSTECDTFLQYTSVWLTFQNRGGLFVVSDTVYKFFRSLELVTRKHLSLSCTSSESLKDSLTKHIFGNVNVQNMWCKISCSLESHLSEPLFSAIVNYWVKIRISSYVKFYVTSLKREARISIGKKKALRKELKKKQKK